VQVGLPVWHAETGCAHLDNRALAELAVPNPFFDGVKLNASSCAGVALAGAAGVADAGAAGGTTLPWTNVRSSMAISFWPFTMATSSCFSVSCVQHTSEGTRPRAHAS
jgi:hypothetical protein